MTSDYAAVVALTTVALLMFGASCFLVGRVWDRSRRRPWERARRRRQILKALRHGSRA